MEAWQAILLFALPFVLYFVLKGLMKKYFQKLYLRTKMNLIGLKEQLLGFGFFVALLICGGVALSDSTYWFLIIIPILLVVALVIGNLKLKNPASIIICTVCQLVFGMLFMARVLIWLFLVLWNMFENILHGGGDTVTYNPFSFIDIEKDGKIKEYKTNDVTYTPDPNQKGILTDMNRYTDSIDRSRASAERNAIMQQLAENDQQRNEALAYGLDVSEFNEREERLKKDLNNIK